MSEKVVSLGSDEAAKFLLRHTLPLGLKSKSTDKPWDKVGRATFTLLRVGKRNVFLTCAHVHDRHLQMKTDDASAEIVAYTFVREGFAELNGFSLLDLDRKSLDVAIYRGLDDDAFVEGVRFIEYPQCYATDLVVGEPVVIVGYPAANVGVTEKSASLNFMQLVLRLSSISERTVTLANECGDRQFIDFHEPPRDKIFLGGLSGAPAFVIRESRHQFVGIVTDCTEEDQTIVISRLGCLSDDGMLDHAMIPW